MPNDPAPISANFAMTYVAPTISNGYLNDNNSNTVNINQELSSGGFYLNSSKYKVLSINIPVVFFPRAVNCNYTVAGTISSVVTISSVFFDVKDSTGTVTLATVGGVNSGSPANALTRTIDINIPSSANGTVNSYAFLTNFTGVFSNLYEQLTVPNTFRIFMRMTMTYSLVTTATGGNKTYTASFTPTLLINGGIPQFQNPFSGSGSVTVTATPIANGNNYSDGFINMDYRVLSTSNTSYFNDVRGFSLYGNSILFNKVILTNTAQIYGNTRAPTYIFHFRTDTITSGISLPSSNIIYDGQYLYVKKIGTASYNLNIQSPSNTFLILQNLSVSTFTITNLNGVAFIYDKPNNRWIQVA